MIYRKSCNCLSHGPSSSSGLNIDVSGDISFRLFWQHTWWTIYFHDGSYISMKLVPYSNVDLSGSKPILDIIECKYILKTWFRVGLESYISFDPSLSLIFISYTREHNLNYSFYRGNFFDMFLYADTLSSENTDTTEKAHWTELMDHTPSIPLIWICIPLDWTRRSKKVYKVILSMSPQLFTLGTRLGTPLIKYSLINNFEHFFLLNKNFMSKLL